MRVCVDCGKPLSPRSKVALRCIQCFGISRRTGWTTKKGYRRIGIGGRYVMEHRYVMEQSIGRPLRADEEVHHINGDRADNRLENLILESSHIDHMGSHHKAATWSCLECGTVFESSPKYRRSFCSRSCFYKARTGKPRQATFEPAPRS